MPLRLMGVQLVATYVLIALLYLFMKDSPGGEPVLTGGTY
jgi:hypothetical protein